MEYQINEFFFISLAWARVANPVVETTKFSGFTLKNTKVFWRDLAWAEGGIDAGDPILKVEKCCEGVRAPPTPQKSAN